MVRVDQLRNAAKRARSTASTAAIRVMRVSNCRLGTDAIVSRTVDAIRKDIAGR